MLLYRLPSDKENAPTGRVFLFESSVVDSFLTADTFIRGTPPQFRLSACLYCLNLALHKMDITLSWTLAVNSRLVDAIMDTSLIQTAAKSPAKITGL